MRGDILVIEDYHKRAAENITQAIIKEIKNKNRRFTITIAGESGSGKSEMAKALKDDLESHDIKTVILAQDDYFVLPPYSNDARRREDPEWLGPHMELKLDVLDKNLKDVVQGKKKINKPLIDYEKNLIEEETTSLEGVKVAIAEGTYTSLLRYVDKRIFIGRCWPDTLAHRKKRNRGDEVGDPFIEKVLSMEHKIIAGHKQLADILITKDYDVNILD